MDDNKPKISPIEAILMLMFVGLADAAEFFFEFFIITAWLSWIVDIIVFPVTQLWLRFKGIKGTYNLVSNLLEFLPLVSALPLRTAGMIVTIIIDRNPKLKEKVEKYASVKKPAAAAKPIK